MQDQTLAIHAGFKSDPTTKAVAVPIYQTVAYEIAGLALLPAGAKVHQRKAFRIAGLWHQRRIRCGREVL